MNLQLGTAIDGILSAQSESDLCQAGTDLLSTLFDSPASIYSLSDSDELVIRATTASSLRAADWALPLTDDILRKTARLRRPARIDDCAATRSTEAAEPSLHTYRSALLAPIRDWGLVIVADESPGVFDDRHLVRASVVAELLGAVIEDLDRPSEPDFAEARLETIASTLSHDIANPINVAQGYLAEAIETGDTEHLEAVRTAIDRIGEITDRLALFARTGRTVESLSPVLLDDVAQAAWSMVETGEASLVRCGSEPMLADESRLRQLLENLFANAIAHGGPTVTVRVGALATESGFFVEDDGRGIAPEDREVIFDHGYSDKEAHSGYGLSIVRGIVEAHGWRIAVTDSETGGARFEISDVTLPGNTDG